MEHRPVLFPNLLLLTAAAAIAIALPLALGALAAWGYLYTAGVLLGALFHTFLLAIGIAILHQLIVRWIVLARRRILLQAARERRNMQAAEAQGTGFGGAVVRGG